MPRPGIQLNELLDDMAVYVDSMMAGYGHMKMCHMVADTTEELLAMADRIGVARRWLQKAGTPHEHFDVCLSMRRAAVRAGAVEITMRQLAYFIRDKRVSLSSNTEFRRAAD